MTRQNRILLFLFLHIFIFSSLSAQYQDFRTWWSAGISGDLTSDLSAELDISQRFNENSLLYDRSLATIGLGYDITKRIKIEGGYRYILVKDGVNEFESRYRVHGDISYEYKFPEFSIQIRERFQYGFDDLNSIDYYFGNSFTNRTRIKAEYPVFGWPLKLHAMYEFFLDLNSDYGILPSAHRIKAGVDIHLSSKSNLDLSYMMENEINTVYPIRSHILQISYGYKF